MRVLIDTHVFLWWVEGDCALPARARAALADQDNECLFSLASAWELSIKTGLGKLKLALPVRMAHIGRVESLPRHHGDPFDRLLIAQALEEKLPVVTADPIFRDYGVKRIW